MTAEDAKPLSGWAGTAHELDWNAVYADQLPRIYNFFRFRLGPGHDIEELTSRTFEKAWRARAQYRRDLAAFSTWLFSIARNVVTDHLRSHAVQQRVNALCEDAEQSGPEVGAMQGSDLTRLAALTAHLPERHRELLALKYGAALNNRQIAQVSGLSESNVGTTLQRIVEKLRERW